SSDPVTESDPTDAGVCGDGILDAGEDCDDGNTTTENCEYGETACTVCDAQCQSIDGQVAYCGDGNVEDGIETCDDGNAETEACDYGEESCLVCDASCQSITINGSYCGDGIVQEGLEVCDDGNQQDGDYCSADCSAASTVCGDGVLEGNELCDDGNESNLDGCLNDCTLAACGDGFTYQGLEACDDGNDSNNDACLNDCSIARCGDNFVQTDSETCDDGNTMTERCDYGLQSCMVCDAWCQEVEGVTTFCGDGVVQTVETCDLGDANSDAYGSQCKNDCTGPSSTCGDGILDAEEACDDGNDDDNDYCTNDCQTSRTCLPGLVESNGHCIACPGSVDTLVVNGSGELTSMDGWTVTANGGDGWRFFGNGGYDSIPGHFGTSYGWGYREQVVDLLAMGYSEEELDSIPPITVGEYYRTFFNNNDFYTLTIELRDQADVVIASYTTGNVTVTNSEWTWAGTTFSDYEAGVRKVYIRDGGKDSEFWSGHYGTRIDGTQIRIALDTGPACSGNGQCVPADHGDGACLCDPGFSGPACAIGEAISYCGDGTIDEGEACDDGEANNDAYGSDCNLSCSGPAAYCGDGILDAQETCDDGLSNSDVYGSICNTTCSGPASYCGDGIVDAVEACDDGNNDEMDYCSADCQEARVCLPGLVESDDLCLACPGAVDPLVVNGSGELASLDGWTITQDGGNGWTYNSGNSVDAIPGEFATSYSWAFREQVVDLLAMGYTAAELDTQPAITVGEYYRAIFNNNDLYTLTVELRDAGGAVIASFETGTITATTSAWTWAGTTFADYGEGVRQIYIRDGGKDTEYWAGHYGTRMDGMEIRIALDPTTPCGGNGTCEVASNGAAACVCDDGYSGSACGIDGN
ncbi:MAG: DUF4215 domain-containing protein, partial [Myxococcota bacterium]|nr:DUF4215 domain-containing protein [Myxococcota bacterium]